MYLNTSENKKKEKKIIFLFLILVIINQGIRSKLNTTINSSIFNYHFVSIILILMMVLDKRNKINIKNMILIIGISGLLGVSFINNKYTIDKLLRMIIDCVLPLSILLISTKDVDVKYIFQKLIKVFNIFISCAFVIQIIMSFEVSRTGGILGHPLTAGWYYAIFISFNCIYNKYFSTKKDIYIIKDIYMALIGTVLASGRMAMIIVLLLGILYAISCCKNKVLIYFIIPVSIILFLGTSLVDEQIWSKFKNAAAWGDITNGRLLGIKEILFYKIYPKIFTGMGIGYSDYVTMYLLSTINFENPIIMFAFDYGIVTVIFLVIIIFVNPICKFINERNYYILANYLLVCIIPFTYNGLAQSIGIFMTLIFIIYLYLLINEYISTSNKYIKIVSLYKRDV